jgi:thiol-disulfide isomerase/thioredoxin
MDIRRAFTLNFAAAMAVGILGSTTWGADNPTPAQALTFSPIQPLVEYTIPSKEEAAQCTIRPEKENNVTSWVVRNRGGEVLRRFADTNADNVVDEWCYFQDGIEVYRDIDSNFNGKADQYRWFNTAGTRWGIDKNEDGKVDSWKVISPHEVAEQVVIALKTNDQARFQLLLLTPAELAELGFGKARQDSISASIGDAPAAFSKLAGEQKSISVQTRYVDFGSARPGTIPASTDGATKDVTICDNGAALVQTGDKHDQVFIGTLVSVGSTWKLISAPMIGADNQRAETGLLTQGRSMTSGQNGEGSPSDEMQKQMAELERLDKEADSLPPEKLAANIDQRVAALRKLAEISPLGSREQWYRQLIDVLGVAIQSGVYPNGVATLAEVQKSLEDAKADEDLIAHAVFQGMWAQFSANQHTPNANMAQLQEKWLADLKTFVEQHPKSSDAAEALLQLGMYQDFVGKGDEATKWYQQLVDNFPNAKPTDKATGALRRLGIKGKPMVLKGADIQGGNVDLSAAPYRGKVVLVQYWATWCEPCKADMVLLKDLLAKRGGRDFDIIGVCLNTNSAEAKQLLVQEKYPWKNIFEPGGLDSRIANEMGIMTLPVMILVDQRGNVVNQNIQVAELEAELAKLIKPAGVGTANSLRPPAKPR